MQLQDAFNRIANDLVGVRVSHLWRGYGSAIFLEFGPLSDGGVRRDGSKGNERGEFTLGLEWSWRIEDATSILCGSWSEEALWHSAFDKVRNAQVLSLSVFGRLPEVDLALSNGLHVVSFMTAEGQPEWSLADRRQKPTVWLSVKGGVLAEEPARN